MKRLLSYILIFSVCSGLGFVAYRHFNQTPDQPKIKVASPERPIASKVAEPEPVPVIAETELKKVEEPERVAQTPEPRPKPAAPPAFSEEEHQQMLVNQYYERKALRFMQQQHRLDQEQDPAQRKNIIQTLARYVRTDTLEALDWAASLETPEEKRLALEAINRNAISGIGARLGMDESGLPKIEETTILSAVESSGMIEPGDYISGMVTADGSTIFFKDMNIQQIASLLRGKPGTEIQLMMERVAPDGTPSSFDVPIQRSLLVMQPPSDG